MSREILFRGRRLDNGAWESGGIIIRRGGTLDETVYISDKMTGYPTPVCHSTVGQYTGLVDRHGVKIFEGDIVAVHGGLDDAEYVFSVRHGECGGVENVKRYGYMGFYFSAYNEETKKMKYYGLRNDPIYWLNERECEVVGNIHGNAITGVQYDNMDNAEANNM